jgi:protein-L-isoaspartate O-methyltransferase
MTNGALEEAYVLGHSESELHRLISQARFFGDLTEDVFVRAGIGAGMEILDVGCGAGDISFLAARLAGQTGRVHGIDKSPEAVALARARAKEAGLENVTFEVADAANYHPAGTFDAIVGRLVLLYLPEPGAALRSLTDLVRPGGRVVFHEADLTTARSQPLIPLFEDHFEIIRETLRRAGVNVDMGSGLYRIYRQAGLGTPTMIAHSRVEASACSEVYDQLVGIARALLPLIEQLGVASASSLDLDTFADRLRAEVLARDAVIVTPLFVGAWATVGGPAAG